MPMGLGRYIKAEKKAFELIAGARGGARCPGTPGRAPGGDGWGVARVVALKAIKRARSYLRRLSELLA